MQLRGNVRNIYFPREIVVDIIQDMDHIFSLTVGHIDFFFGFLAILLYKHRVKPVCLGYSEKSYRNVRVAGGSQIGDFVYLVSKFLVSYNCVEHCIVGVYLSHK